MYVLFCALYSGQETFLKNASLIQIVLSLIAWRNTRGPNKMTNNNCTVTLELILTKDHSNILIHVAYMKYHCLNN